MKDGYGKMKYSNNNIYKGLWKDNVLNDENGIFKFENGNIYTG